MLFVTEIGLNHDGNFDLAYELIRQSSAAGADVAKFQFGWRDKPDEINHISKEQALQLRRWCDYWEIEMMASIIKEEAIELAHAADLKRYKIASRTVVDQPDLVWKLLDEGKETFVSLGMWEQENWPFGKPGDQLRYIFCKSSYPCYPEELVGMPQTFSRDGFYGYSDHLHGAEACLLAIARGAQFIEKHFTLNRTSQVIRDHVHSGTPPEWFQLIHQGRDLARLRDIISDNR